MYSSVTFDIFTKSCKHCECLIPDHCLFNLKGRKTVRQSQCLISVIIFRLRAGYGKSKRKRFRARLLLQFQRLAMAGPGTGYSES